MFSVENACGWDINGVGFNPVPIIFSKARLNLSETFSAMRLGYNSVPKKCDLLILGEMGISNTTSATAISCALFNTSVKKWTGLGTGVSERNLKNKISVIQKGLRLHGKKFHSVVEILSCFGGREMAETETRARVASRLLRHQWALR